WALYGPVTVLRLPTAVDAHDAARHGAAYATGDLLAFLAAGAVLAPDALPRCAAALAADPRLGAVVAHTRARHAETNLLTRAQDAWLDSRFRVTVAAEAAVGALTDAPAGAWLCRREAVYAHLAAWEPGRSLGALVRGQRRDGARWRLRHADSPFAGPAARPGRAWRVGYVASARVYVPVPDDVTGFLAAQGRRWARAAPALAATLRYAGAGGAAWVYAHAAARLVGPVAAAWCLVGAPATGAWAATVAYLAAVGVAGLAQGIAAALERPHVPGWAYQPVSRLSGALLHPLVPAYALLHAVRARRAAAGTR
ncbi:MAG TPA: glycosyltransferase, partial [Pilimelia sp.]|nr:glycosyltransferase [Pilimelia sp.]